MAVKRQLNRVFSPTHQTLKSNLLVSGCSYTWNNSNDHPCTWPYYLRDIANYTEVYDCSQSSGGNTHVFNSIMYELETNQQLTPENTDIIIMWSGMERADLLTQNSIVQDWFHMDHMTFNNEEFASLNVHPYASWATDKRLEEINKFLKLYRVIVDSRAQILESCLKIIALKGLLNSRGFNSIFLTFRPIEPELQLLNNSALTSAVINLLDPIEDLDTFTTNHSTRIPNDGHPTPDAHLSWTRSRLVPFLTGRFITVK